MPPTRNTPDPGPEALPADPRAVVAQVERLVADLAARWGVSPQDAMDLLEAHQPQLVAAYRQAKNNPAVPALPASAPTSPDSLKMVQAPVSSPHTKDTIMAHVIAEVAVDHPIRSVIDQLDGWYVRKTLAASEYTNLVRTIHEAKGQLDDPTTAALLIELTDGRAVWVAKYVPSTNDGQRVHIQKRQHRSPSEEVEARAGQDGQAQARILAEDPDLYPRHVAAMRAGTGNPQPVAKADPPSYETIVKMAKAQAKASGQTTEQALAALAQADPQTYYAAYRQRIVSGAGLEDHLTRRIQALGGKAS